MKPTPQQPISPHIDRRLEGRLLTPLLVVAASAVAVLSAPMSHAAATDPGCTATGSATVCQQPGNAQFTATPPPVQFHPYGALSGPPVHSHSAPVHDHHD
jgi:hypothetical protein